jgi:MYND finger
LYNMTDQRCIWSSGSNGTYSGYGHHQFVEIFVTELSSQQGSIDLTKPGNYQERYNVYKALSPSYQEGLKYPFHSVSGGDPCVPPINYTGYSETITASCHNRGCWNFSANLKACSKCKVVCYCSRKCQVADWPDHKKQCKEMANLSRDKEAVATMAKNM